MDRTRHNNNPMDAHGHGTHVAGTIGATGNNGVGVAGVNWNVRIMPVKFLNAQDSGSTADAISAVLYAAQNGADVTNISKPQRKPSEAGLRAGVLMRRGDAKPRRAARLMTIANDEPLERAG